MTDIENAILRSIHTYDAIGALYDLLEVKSSRNCLQGIPEDLQRLDDLFETARQSDQQVMEALGPQSRVADDLLRKWSNRLQDTRARNQSLARRISGTLAVLRSELKKMRSPKFEREKFSSGLPKTAVWQDQSG
ncbi:MAG: hypothetical protein ACQERN_13575 [Thermodesulfobacteriota bacterium]